MLALIKARLRDERTYTALFSLLAIAAVWITMKMGPSAGLRGSDLKDVLGVESAFGIAIAAMLKSLRHKDPKSAAKHRPAPPTHDDAEDADA
jgi:hypothetical protein